MSNDLQPMIIEGVLAMLACAVLGNIQCIWWFFSQALQDGSYCGSRFVITADSGLRGAKSVPLKENV